jgi:hypothetical protein
MRMATARSHQATINKPGYTNVLNSVRAAIHRCLCRYDIVDVEDALDSMNVRLPRVTVSRAMHRLLREKEILVAERGNGPRATIYKKPGT